MHGRLNFILVWLSEQITCSKLLLGLVAKFCFGVYSAADKGFRAGSVCYPCVVGRPFMYVWGGKRYIFFWYHDASPKYLDLFRK